MNNKYVLIMVLPLLAACDSLPSWMGGAPKEIVRLPGTREDVLLTDHATTADATLATVPANFPTVFANGNWAQHNGQFTAATGNLALSGDLSNEHSASIGDGNAFSSALIPRPVVASGKVYAMDASGVISAHKTGDIADKIWTSEALVHEDGDEVMGGGLAVSEGTLYAVCGIGNVAAINTETGAELWKRNLAIPLRSAPHVVGNQLFVITIDSQLFALDAATGKTLWTHRGINETAGLMNAVSPAVAGSVVLVPYASGELYALSRETGEEVWRVSLAQTRRTTATAIFSGIGGDPLVDDSVVFAVSNGGLFSVFNLLNGQPLWEKPVSSLNTPWISGDYIFLLTDDNVLLSMLKYDGRIRWATRLQRFEDEERRLGAIVWRGPVMVADKLVMVSSHSELALVDGASGTIDKTIDIADGIGTAPIVAEGRLYLVSNKAKLYEFQ